MCLILIGEAGSRIAQRSPAFVSDPADWPWSDIRGLRNRIVHDYYNLDISVIWQVVTKDLPDLIVKIEALGELDPRLQQGN